MDALTTPGPIRAVIFDMDGVLTDSEPLINAAAIAMFREKGLEVRPEDFLPFVGAGEDRYLGGVAEKSPFWPGSTRCQAADLRDLPGPRSLRVASFPRRVGIGEGLP